jgi:uracil-DNA glycosylase
VHGDDKELDAAGESTLRLIRELRQRLEGLHRAGVRDLPRAHWIEPEETDVPVTPVSPEARADTGGPALDTPPRPADDLPARKPAVAPTPVRAPALPAISLFQEPGFETDQLPPAERPTALKVLAEEVAVCRKCANLAATRTQTVFADGSPSARLMFIGEAPGADEDRTGVPFVGRAGQLLTDMITKGMGMKRKDVYIANILKCRPPENRDPTGEESTNCLPYLERQIDILRPEFICLLGRVAVQYLLGTSLSMGKLRGKWHRYKGIATIVTYHPAYLLRTPAAKKDAWEDLQLLMNAMGLPVPSRRTGQD